MKNKSPVSKSTPLEPKAERIQILLDELDMAIRWRHPSILLAVYRSEFIRRDVEKEIRKHLIHSGHKTIPYLIDKDNFDVPLDLSRHPERSKSVFLVSGIKRGGGRGGNNAYRALNIRRELLIDYSIRSIFWLTMSEAAALPRKAPDFWAFRHRVVEFTDQPSSGKRIQALEEARGKTGLHSKDPRTWNALGNAYYELGRFDEAIDAFRRATRLDPGYTSAWKNLASVYDDSGRVKEAEYARRKLKPLTSKRR